ncbi:MAG TPA: transporter substrate-binding domain-containing protein [Actinomycetota bacterium]|nr:transporter substrate-binding domain-containing protein [Actinomycetota bacterium]
MRRTIGALVAAALLAAACGGGGEGSGGGGGGSSPQSGEASGMLADVLDRGVLRVSTDPAYPPQSFLNEEGDMEGFDIDVATEIANRLGVDIAWETPAWDTIIAGNWQGRWDISVGSMTVTPEREDVLHFTPAYYYTPAAVAVHRDNTTITDLATDLDGKTIGVCGGCTYEFFLEGSLEIPGEQIDFVVDDPDVKPYDTDSSAIQDLALGDGVRLDAVMSALPTLKEAEDKDRPVKIVGDPLFYEPLAAAIDKNAPSDPMPFVEEVSGIIEQMHDDGTLSELSTKWYGVDLTKKSS